MRKKLTRRTKVLELLYKHRDKYISGEQLSNYLDVSRTTIWKYINYFKDAGYKIESSSKLGYQLVKAPDILLPEEIDLNLDTKIIGQNIVHYNQVESTNQLAKEQADSNVQEGTVIIAEKQIGGKGRIGRQFFSPQGGIWLSCILRPDLKPVLATRVTYIASLAIARTINELTRLTAKIKWPNDILVNGQKISGILTEMGAELDKINYLIVGMGVNANIAKDNLPKNLEDKATTLEHELKEEIDRVKFVQLLLKNIEEIYLKTDDFSSVLNEWKKYSYTIGEEITVVKSKGKVDGWAVDIANDGALIIETNNKRQKVYSGDVSLRHQNLKSNN